MPIPPPDSPGTDRREILLAAYRRIEELEARLRTAESRTTEPVAIVGLACRFPGADNPDAFWRILQNGVDPITEIPASRWNIDEFFDPNPGMPGKMLTRVGGFLENVDRFDPEFFGIAPREASSIDPQQRLLLELTWEALESAGLTRADLATSPTGVFVGISGGDYGRLQTAPSDGIDPYTAAGNAHSIAAGRLSYVLGVRGPSIAVDTACSSSLVALHLACQSLRVGECRTAVVGAINLILSPLGHVIASKAMLLAPDGRCKTFDAKADGYVRSEGCGVVVVKRLSDAQADGDRVLAIVRGTGVNHDGRSAGLTAPNGLAQEELIRQVLTVSGVEPADVTFVETQGTGTALSDPIETLALAAVHAGRPTNQPLYLGAVKTNVGHAEAAAGMAGLIKTILALRHAEIPPNLHFSEPNPHIPWGEIPIRVPVARTPWPSEAARRIAGVSAFGFSGTNAHVLLEAADSPAATTRNERPLHLFVTSARSDTALKELVDRHVTALEGITDGIGDICFTAGLGRSHFEHRLAVVCDSREDLFVKLRAFQTGADSPGVSTGKANLKRALSVGFYFPAKSRLPVGSARRLFETLPIFKRELARCSDLLSPILGRDLLSLMYPIAANEREAQSVLDTQPAGDFASFAIQYALAQVWQSWRVAPSAAAGQGVGAYVAGSVAGVFALEGAVSLLSRGLPDGQFAAPRVPLISRVTGQPLSADEACDPSSWRWPAKESPNDAAMTRALGSAGANVIVTMTVAPAGPKPSAEPLLMFPSLGRDGNDWESMLHTLAQLYVRGADIDWKAFDRDFARRKTTLASYPFQRERYWIEAGRSTKPLDWPVARERGAPTIADAAAATASVSTSGEDRSAMSGVSHTRQHVHSDLHIRLARAKPAEREQIIAAHLDRLAAKILGLRPGMSVGTERDLSEAGMDSIMAAELFLAIETTLGKKLPLVTLLEAPTLGALARLLAKDRPLARRWLIVPLKPSGDKRPFFCVHGIGGEVISFARMTPYLDAARPFYGLQAVDTDAESFVSIEAMAARYVAGIRGMLPHGPYLLGGYSSGGVVALEMAHQLREAGEQVHMLALLDVWAPHSGSQTPRWRLSSMLDLLANIPYWIADDVRHASPKELYERTLSKLRVLKTVVGRRFGRTAAKQADVRDALGLWRYPENRRAWLQAHYDALAKYRAKPYPGRVTLFRARGGPLLLPRGSDMGWGAVAQGGVDVRVIPGNHGSLFQEPVVQSLARELSDRLNGADADVVRHDVVTVA
jgi:acyl transferase domain-containing protein/thioesterase domain-containing protein